MDEDLKNALEEGETILFKGKPEPFQTLDKISKPPFVITTVLTVLICTALCVSYAVNTIPSGTFKILLPIVVAAIGILIISSVFRDARRIRNQQYVITNKRLIRKGEDVCSLPYSAVTQYVFKEDEEGHTSLLIGPDGIKAKSKNWRKLGASSLSVNTENGKCEQAVFYGIPQPEEFRKIFVEQVLKNGR